jgi:hypothetical protein
MAALGAVEVRKESRFTPPRFNFLLGVILLLLFPIRTFAADPTMTLLKRESQPISEGQTIIRSQYRVEPPPFAGVQMPPFTVTKELTVVGCGVNYDVNRGTGQPVLAPSHAALAASTVAGVAFESTASPLQIYLPNSADHPLAIARNGRTVFSRFVGANAATAVKTGDHTARYANVFADTDLLWQVGNGYLKESLILRSRAAPQEFSFELNSPNLIFLAPSWSGGTFTYAELSLTDQPRRISGELMLADAENRANRRMAVLTPLIKDTFGRFSHLECYVSRTRSGAVQYRLRIPNRFLAVKSLSYPLTLDPTFINVSTATRLSVFQAGVTYFIDGPVLYTTETVRVEANAILKFRSERLGAYASWLEFSGASQISVDGTPYNYAYFTSGFDDSVGVDTDGPSTSGLPLLENDPWVCDYDSAIRVFSPNYCSIHYAKFAYAGEAIVVNDPDGEAGPNLLVEHSIFRDDLVGVAIGTETTGVTRTSTVNNCLFVGPRSILGAGVLWGGSSDQETPHKLSLTNCTMDYFRAGVYIVYDGPGNEFHLLRNIFKDTGYVVDRDGSFGGAYYEIDYNGRCGTYADEYFWTEPRDLDPDAVHNVTETGNPFVTNANGSYYLNAQTIFRNAGDITAAAAGLSAKTTNAATGSRIKRYDIGGVEFWSPMERDDDAAVDLGYHYDPVDIIIEPEYSYLYLTGAVYVLPGVTVAFSDEVSPGAYCNTLFVWSFGTLDMRGTGSQPIRVSSTLACGDKIGNPASLVVPGDTGLFQGVYVTLGGTGAFEYCTIENAFCGLALEGWTAPVKGCRFSGCWQGVEQGAFNGTRTIENCLFRDIRMEGVLVWRSGPATILNSTFYRCEGTAVYFGVGSSGNSVRNSIFVQNQLGIHKEPETGLAEDHNCFYDNGPDGQSHADFALQGQPPNVYADPKFDNTTAADLYERFFLKQNSPCVDAGDTSVLIARLADFTTRRTASADRGLVDIGYHYGPACRGGYDSDGDGMDDQWEIFFHGSTTARSGTEDDDGDGMTTAQEYLFKSNPLVPDIAVRLYRDDAYSRPITDWDEWPGVNRQSPRFIFSQLDAIYIEARGIQTASPTLTDEIKVVSESNPTGIYITLRQTSPGSGVFRSTDEPLCLHAMVSYDPPAEGKHWIKIVDEEKLTFSFETIASGVTREVLVDLGEYAGCGIDELYRAEGYEYALNESWGYEGHWFCAGDHNFPNDVGGGSLDNEMGTFIRNAGENYAYSRQADFLYMSAHGIRTPDWTCNGELYGRAGHIFDPDHPNYGVHLTSDWNQDLEWVFVDVCYVMADCYGAPYKGWSTGLGGSPRRVHALLGNHELGGGALNWLWYLIDPARAHMNVIEGYQQAAHATLIPWATYCIFSNRADKVDEVTPDNDEADPWCVYEDDQPTSRSEHLYAGAGSTGGSLDGGKCLVVSDLASIAGAGLILPRTVTARTAFPSVRDDFPITGYADVSPWGNALHVGKWEIAGHLCPYTTEEAQAVVEAFVEKQLPTLANRVKWRGPSMLRWGIHRQSEPLLLQTGGYSVPGDLAYSGVPLLYDRVDVTILGDTVECVSVTCHEIVQTATESLTVENCRTIVEKALPEVKAALAVSGSYAILDARLVFLGPLDRYSDEAKRDSALYRPAWAVVLQSSPGVSDWTNVWTVFLDAASGEYLGHVRGWGL